MITLSNVMKANATSCIGFGIIFSLFSGEVSHFLSLSKQAPNIVFILLGLALIFNGCHLIWASLKSMPSKYLVLYFSIGDYIWVLATLYLIFAKMWITTLIGIITALFVAVVVGTFGWLQIKVKDPKTDINDIKQ